MPHLQPANEQVSAIQIRRAFNIKLGRGGEWEADSLARNLMRIGWPNNSLDDINSGNWDALERQLRNEISHTGTATRAVTSLREIVTSTAEDVWITFHGSRLWWCRLA